MRNFFSALAVSVLSILILTGAAAAMNSNLATPYSDTCSGPQTPDLSFYSPQSTDLLFSPEMLRPKKAPIEIFCQAGLRCVGMTWTLHRNMIDKPFREGQAEALTANRFHMQIVPDGLPPGFYDLRVVLDTGMPPAPNDPRPVTGVCVFGWRVPQMAIRDSRPADFKAFWDKAKADITKVPLDARNETPMVTFTHDQINDYNVKSAALPPDYDPAGHRAEEVESCKISFAGPDGGRVYAWLAKPKGPGPFPAMLVLPGAGFNARPRPLEHARHGYVAIDIQIHGQDVDLAGEYPKLPGYYDPAQFQPIDAYYFYKVHQRVLQAVSYLLSRPDVDPRRLAVAGGSQGGRLCIVAAGLDPRITAVVAGIANSPNHPHLAWVDACNGANGTPKTDGMELTGAPPLETTPKGICWAYYDPMNYAPDIHCPVYCYGGLIDPVSPPYSVYAVYHRLASKNKIYVPLPGLAHDWSGENDRRAWRWLNQVWKDAAK
ncbi:MAG: acetylxylan esterase [Janthinobacterium lividum]